MKRAKRPASDDLLAQLDLAEVAPDRFVGLSPDNGWKRVFGGQVLGQAMVAATRTVEGRDAHSLHAYFILGGDPTLPITYAVERVRDGGSFSTRRVVALQRDAMIFAMMVSFHKQEDGFEHQMPMPSVPQPEELPDEATLKARLPRPLRGYVDDTWPIEMRVVDLERYLDPSLDQPGHRIWMRARRPLPADAPLSLHQCVLVYASDYSLIETGLIGHGYLLGDPRIQAASLDHAVWLHRPFRADDWLLYVQDSPSAQGARALCRGSYYTRDGKLVASIAQEGLLRIRTPQPKPA